MQQWHQCHSSQASGIRTRADLAHMCSRQTRLEPVMFESCMALIAACLLYSQSKILCKGHQILGSGYIPQNERHSRQARSFSRCKPVRSKPWTGALIQPGPFAIFEFQRGQKTLVIFWQNRWFSWQMGHNANLNQQLAHLFPPKLDQKELSGISQKVQDVLFCFVCLLFGFSFFGVP